MNSTKNRTLTFSATLLALVATGLILTSEATAGERLQHPLPEIFKSKIFGRPDKLPSQVLKVELLEWIGDNTDYDTSGTIANPPTVKFCTHGSTLIYQGKAIHFDDRLNGVYDEMTKQICLAKPWDPTSIKAQGILLHELIHHVQYENKSWACAKATEWQAYKLQEKWLIEKGGQPDLNWMYILLASSCTPRDVHP